MTQIPSLRRLRLMLAWLLAASPAAAERIEVAVKSVPLNPLDETVKSVGPLESRGGIVLTSSDSRLGGFSSLRLTEAGQRITFVSDEGNWFTARLVHDDRGFLQGLAEAEMGPLLGLDDKPLLEKTAADAESLAVLPDGDMVVGFEHQHRLWRYPVTGGRPEGHPTPLPLPPGLSGAPANGGVEAMVATAKGRLIALTEYWIVDGLIRGFTDGPPVWRSFGYRFEGAYRPSDMARLPDGDLMVLERAYNPDRGIVGVRLQHVPIRQVKGGARVTSTTVAELGPPLTVDNFEGIDAVPGKAGETLLYLVSDDNFRTGDQRTLLLMFALPRK
jgi:hypothetical protein